MKLYFMRHGETAWNEQGLLQGSTDIPLNDYGIQLAIATAEGLAAEGTVFDRIFTSPLLRASQTARIIAKKQGVPAIADQRLREMCFGEYEGMKISEIMENPEHERFARFFKAPAQYEKVGTSESFEDATIRAKEFLEECILPLENTCENVLVVCHGGIVRVFLCLIGNIPYEDYWKIYQPNCCVSLTELKNGKLSLIDTGRTYYDLKNQAGRKFV